jgi:signal transduction histidine kinase
VRSEIPNGLEVEVGLEGFEGGESVPHAVEVGLYRIAQQALANVARHARAGHAFVGLSRDPTRVRLRVEDDGVGFNPVTVAPERFGLVGMNERARLLGGTLVVESSPGKGTVIETVVPLGSRPP